MSFWNSSQILNINEGVSPNDGTGDNIRDAFLKVDSNFGNVSDFLSQDTVQFLNANVSLGLNANTANLNSITVATIASTVRVFGNINMSANIVPSAANQYDLGSSERPFKSLYVQTTVSSSQVQTSSDAGLLQIHANAAIGDVKDVGILGNISSNYTSNAYAFFGHQYTSNNFVYKITPNNAATLGNSVVYDGVYGNVQFGSLFLSNVGTANALIVSGSIRAQGNVFIVGNAYSAGYQILTTNSPGMANVASTLTVTGTIPSTGTTNGALVITNGGAGIAGNVYAGGLLGPYYGTVQQAAQPNITSVGTLTGLTVSGGTLSAGTISAAGIGVTNLTVTGTTSIAGSLSGLASISVGSISAATIGNTGAVLTGTISVAAQPNITSVGTLTSLSVTGNVTAGNFVTSGNIYATNLVGSGQYLTGVASTATVNAINANVTAANTAISTLQANVGAYQTYANTSIQTTNNNLQTVSANIGAYQTYANTSIQSTNANIGAFHTYANTSIQSTNANIGAFHTYANATFGTSNYTNASVAAYLPSYGGAISVSSITASSDLVGNIGSAGVRFNTVFAKATSALYADLAENYESDCDYSAGTVVVFGGDKEITVTGQTADPAVAGVVSTNPAYLMNGAASGLPIALRGRVPVKLMGAVKKGDLLVTANIPGVAKSVGIDVSYGAAVFAKSLTTLDQSDDEVSVIEAVIL